TAPVLPVGSETRVPMYFTRLPSGHSRLRAAMRLGSFFHFVSVFALPFAGAFAPPFFAFTVLTVTSASVPCVPSSMIAAPSEPFGLPCSVSPATPFYSQVRATALVTAEPRTEGEGSQTLSLGRTLPQ